MYKLTITQNASYVIIATNYSLAAVQSTSNSHKTALVDQLTQQRGLEVHKMALVDQLTVVNS